MTRASYLLVLATASVTAPIHAQARPAPGPRFTISFPTAKSGDARRIVTGIRAETATITASAEGRTAMATVVVSAHYGYDLIHSGWPDYPFGEWRLFVARLGGGPSQPLLPAGILPEFALTQAAASPNGRRVRS
jgi:hypothetical protein